MKLLVNINIFSCGITNEGKARILLNLPKLHELDRGDFLCDALGKVITNNYDRNTLSKNGSSCFHNRSFQAVKSHEIYTIKLFSFLDALFLYQL